MNIILSEYEVYKRGRENPIGNRDFACAFKRGARYTFKKKEIQNQMISLYRVDYPNGTQGHVLASNMNDAVNHTNTVLPCGFLETVQRCEWVKKLEVTPELMKLLGLK